EGISEAFMISEPQLPYFELEEMVDISTTEPEEILRQFKEEIATSIHNEHRTFCAERFEYLPYHLSEDAAKLATDAFVQQIRRDFRELVDDKTDAELAATATPHELKQKRLLIREAVRFKPLWNARQYRYDPLMGQTLRGIFERMTIAKGAKELCWELTASMRDTEVSTFNQAQLLYSMESAILRPRRLRFPVRQPRKIVIFFWSVSLALEVMLELGYINENWLAGVTTLCDTPLDFKQEK
ncbi:MAG: hypothetical protein RR276_02185, partial [Angelakisella sp.]